MTYLIFISDKDKLRVKRALRKHGFTNIEWGRDTVRCSHKSHGGAKPKGICDIITALGFYVPCAGIMNHAYAQVWK